jgi:hypothetical protein
LPWFSTDPLEESRGSGKGKLLLMIEGSAQKSDSTVTAEVEPVNADNIDISITRIINSKRII